MSTGDTWAITSSPRTTSASTRSSPDAVVRNAGPFCMHHAGNKRYDFRLKDWTWDTRDGKPYAIPFRCLYSADVTNLMMAGKHISVTHIAARRPSSWPTAGSTGSPRSRRIPLHEVRHDAARRLRDPSAGAAGPHEHPRRAESLETERAPVSLPGTAGPARARCPAAGQHGQNGALRGLERLAFHGARAITPLWILGRSAALTAPPARATSGTAAGRPQVRSR